MVTLGICSAHFVRAAGRRLRSDEVPSVNLPVLATSVTRLTPRRPRERVYATPHNDVEDSGDDGPSSRKDVATQVDDAGAATVVEHVNVQLLNTKIRELEQQQFRLDNIKHDNSKVLFYTGFTCYGSLDALFTFLGPSVHKLRYSKIDVKVDKKVLSDAVPGSYPLLNNFFLPWFVLGWD